MELKKTLLDKKAVIFDMDGTMVDSMWMWKNIDIEYLGSLGHECPEDIQKCIEGMSFYETAVYFKERFNIPDTVEEIMDIWNDMAFDKYQNAVELKPGAYDFIKYLNANGYKLGVATSNSRVLALESLRSRKVIDFFDVIITGDECCAGKPEPDVFLTTAKKLGVKPADCIVFEDLPAGIIAGNRAGMKTVAVDDNYSKHQWDTKCELSDYQIIDFEELVNELCNESI